MPLSRDQVRHVALLARLGLEPGDEDFYAEQLSGILRHATLREDVPSPCLSQEEALANAPAAVDGRFRVPSIQEEA